MRRGFTIIELLVVIAIIGLLAGIAIASVNNTQIRSRDANRIDSIQQIKKALSLYQIENRRFPIHSSGITISGDDALSSSLTTAEVIQSVPVDPLYPTYAYTYQSNTTGSTYVLTFCLETNSIPGYSAGCSNTIAP